MYFPFRTLPGDIGSTDAEIIAHWEQKKGTYTPWHVHRENEHPQSPPTEDQTTANTPPASMQMNEWQILSQLHPSYNIAIDDLNMIGYLDFDVNHNWSQNIIPPPLQETTSNFIDFNHSAIQNQHHSFSDLPNDHTLSPTQSIAFTTIFSHFEAPSPKPPRKIIIQGTGGTGKSHLIKCLHQAFVENSPANKNP